MEMLWCYIQYYYYYYFIHEIFWWFCRCADFLQTWGLADLKNYWNRRVDFSKIKVCKSAKSLLGSKHKNPKKPQTCRLADFFADFFFSCGTTVSLSSNPSNKSYYRCCCCLQNLVKLNIFLKHASFIIYEHANNIYDIIILLGCYHSKSLCNKCAISYCVCLNCSCMHVCMLLCIRVVHATA